MIRVALLAAALLLAGCGGQDRAADERVLRVGVGALPPTRGNPFGANGTPSSNVWFAIFDGLTRLDENGVLQPALATSWRPDGARSWVFELRDGVSFSNGEPFDAVAVKAALDWLGGPGGARLVVGNELRGVEIVEAIGTHRVRITTAEPDAILPNRLAAVLIPAPGAWSRLGPDGFAEAPVGTGPFRIARWDDSGGGLTATRFAGSWRSANVDRIDFIELTDGSVMTQALVSGEIDLGGINIEPISRLRDNGIDVVVAPSMQVMSIAFVTAGRPDSPLSDVRVRRALNLAVDRDTIARTLLEGLGRAAGQPASAQTPGHDPSLGAYPYDPARARALLAEAGWPNGFALRVNVVSGGIPADTMIYQAVEQYLRGVGIDATFHVQPFPTWLQTYLAGTWDADAFGLSWNATPYNDIQRPLEIFSCAKRNPFTCDAELTALVEKLGSETDPDARAALLADAGRAFRDAAPALFLVEQVDLYGATCRARNLVIANRVPVYDAIELDDTNCGENR